MLNRRHLRVKVLQTLYAYQHSENKEVSLHQKNLLKTIDQVYEMYIALLSLLAEVIQYADIDATDRGNKYLPSEEDLNPNLKILNNVFIEAILKHQDFIKAEKKYALSWVVETELVKSIFTSLKASEEYTNYINNKAHTLTDDKEIVKFIFKKLILKKPLPLQAFEDHYINWPVDKEILQSMFAKTLKNFSEDGNFQLAEISPNWVEDREFVVELFYKTIAQDAGFQKLIAQKTKNWEADRIAMTDVIIMKMALSEMLFFSNIPVKVTMNEYLDIAKEYSTPKSNTFVNGILDKILSDLKAENKIKKVGRGLVNN